MDEEEEPKGKGKDNMRGMFSGLKKRIKKSFSQILDPAKDQGGRGRKGMKWEEFEKVMKCILSSQANKLASGVVFMISSCRRRNAPRPSPYSVGMWTPNIPRREYA